MLEILNSHPHSGLEVQTQAVRSAGYHVHGVMGPTRKWGRNQILLSTCSGCDGRWHLVPPSQFRATCGGTCVSPAPDPDRLCVYGRPGPKCQTDAECLAAPGCGHCSKKTHRCDPIRRPPKKAKGTLSRWEDAARWPAKPVAYGCASPQRPPPPPRPACAIGVRGRECSSDVECTRQSNCTRCGKSGYCTRDPLVR